LIASQNLYLDAGKGGSASRIHHYLGYRALLSIIGLVLVSLIAFVLFVAGAIIWIGSLVSLNFEKGSVNAFTRFLVPRPDRIDPAERKLRAGDLLDCFALYLIALDGIGILIDLAAEPFLGPKLRHMSDIGLIHLNVAADLIAYVGASGAALILLLYKAKKRGASLGEELGLSTKGAVRNLAYGAVGWGASLCLMLIVSGGLSHALHKLPDPENPALPLLAFAPDTISRFLLYGMAAIAAPFFEETFFRGVLLNALLLRFKPIYACLLTGFLFGSVHPVGIVEGLTLASLGAVFAWIAYLRKSLAPSMFSHFLQNSFAYLTVYFSFAIIFKP
jgi:membrane protease YdiL (CAAX protease family)